MKELDLVLLSHGGEEKAVEAEEDQKLGNPLLLRRALDHTGPASLPLGSRSSVATIRAPRTTQPAPTRKAAW